MTDLVVTCSQRRWAEWLAEGDCARDAAPAGDPLPDHYQMVLP